MTQLTNTLDQVREATLQYSLVLLDESRAADLPTRTNIVQNINELLSTIGGKTSTSFHKHISANNYQKPQRVPQHQ